MKIKKYIIVLFLLPAILIYLAIFLYPTVRTFLMSFYKIPNLSSKYNEWVYVGIKNYNELLHNSYFMQSMWNVLKIWVIGGFLILSLAILFAVIITSGVRWKGFWRSLIYLPNTVSAVVMSVIWLQYIYNSNFGLLTSVFSFLGFKDLASIQWTDPSHIFVSMLIAFSFGAVGYYMIILIAGIERIPHDFYEAALIEGATIFHKFFKITLPLLRDVFKTTLILWTVTAINFFVWSSTFGLEEPSTMTPGYYMYTRVFGSTQTVRTHETFNVGAGACVGIIITLLILVGSYIINLFFREDRLEY